MTLRRNGAHDVGGLVGLGPISIETDEPVWHAEWEGRTLGATVAAMITGMLVPPTHRAVIEALHPVAYLSMSYFEQWLYGLEQCAVQRGVLSEAEIEMCVTDLMAEPDAPIPDVRNPEILEGVIGLMTKGVPRGPHTLGQPPRFEVGDVVRTKRIEPLSGAPFHTRIPGYAQEACGTVEIVHPPMLLEDALVALGEATFEYVYAVRLRAHDIWPDAGVHDSVVVDLWESYLATEQNKEQL